MKWLITGSGGYLGAHLLSRLLPDGHSIFPLTGKSIASKNRLQYLGVKGVNIPLNEYRRLDHIFQEFKPDVVVHLASLKSPEESNRFPEIYLNNNLGSLKNIFMASVTNHVKIFINASSSSIYGDLDSESISENDQASPISVYGQSKLKGEDYLDDSIHSHISICSLRFFNVVGSLHPQLGEKAKFHLIPATIDRLTTGQRPIIYGHNLQTIDGTPIRDYIHVADAVKAIISSVQLFLCQESRDYAGKHIKINIGSGKGTSVLTVVETIQKFMKNDTEPIFLDSRDGDPVKAIADISLANKLINFDTTLNLEEIIHSCFVGSHF